MDFRHAAEDLACTAAAAGCAAGGRRGRLSVDCLTPASCCCCESCDSEGGSNGLVSGSGPSGPAPNVLTPFLRKKELPNLPRLGLAAMIVLTVGDGTALSMSIDCLRAQTRISRRDQP